MKRILGNHLALCLCGLSVFFTGCNQETVSSRVEVPVYQETGVEETTEAETEEVKKGGPKDVDQTVKSRMDQMSEDRFTGLSGHRAFYFPANHSENAADLRAFQILGLEDGDFYYYYVTTDTDTGEEVHAVARNGADGSGRYKLLYERKQEEAGSVSSFYVHICTNIDGEYRISIYEDGQLSVIDRDGRVMFSRTSQDIQFGSVTQSGGENLLELIDRIFNVGGEKPSYYDRDITSVSTDGRYNFFIPVTLTVNDYTEMEDDGELVTETYLLGYSYMPVGTENSEYLIQMNENFVNQLQYWRELGEDEEERGTPEADWKKAVRAYPDRWGNYMVASGELNSLNVLGILYKWKDPDIKIFMEEKKGASAGGGNLNPIFTAADSLYYSAVSELKGGQLLNEYFFQDAEKGYCPFVGSVKEQSRTILTQDIYRSYEVEVEGGEDRTVQETVKADMGAKEFFSDGSAIERFHVMDNSLGMYVAPGRIINGSYTAGICFPGSCTLVRYGKKSDMGTNLRTINFGVTAEDMGVSILNSLGGQPYVLGADLEFNRLMINTPSGAWITLMTPDLNPSGYQETSTDQELVNGMKERSENSGTYSMSSVDLYGNPDRYGEDNVLVLEDRGNIKILVTTFYNGMQLYEGSKEMSPAFGRSSPGTIYSISGCPLYQAWITGPKEITAVGFDRTDTTYQYMDIAKARVYGFDMEDMMKDAPSRPVPREDTGQADPEDKIQPPDIPKDMQDYWNQAKKTRETKPKPSDSETLPDVIIYETDAMLGDAWKEAEQRRESGRESQEEP